MRYFVFASEEEYKNLGYLMEDNIFSWEKYGIIITGAGYGNIITALRDLPKDSEIINIGYAGSNNIKKGTLVYVNRSYNYHPKFDCKDPCFTLQYAECDKMVVPCYSSGDFVLETDIQEPVAFDMELYAICSLGFKSIGCIKYISDNLCKEDFEEEMKS